MKVRAITIWLSCITLSRWSSAYTPESNSVQEPPEGYYAFVESPSADPPRVRRPPYQLSDKECSGVKFRNQKGPQQTQFNLCGDLNKGYIPKNPMDQCIMGAPYPFELIKNKTLEFFSRTLPILKADNTLPKVAKYKHEDPPQLQAGYQIDHNTISSKFNRRSKRETEQVEEVEELLDDTTKPSITQRKGRKFCDNGGGVLCMLYKAFNGEPLASGIVERRDDLGSDSVEFRRGEANLPSNSHHDHPAPPTPCPAKVEYATPVFARNYQGVWRYVVQIPYEGYFTQTVEVTRCLQSRCHYMEGGCLSSPRWSSLLVAEIYYPDTFLPAMNSRWPSHRNPVSVDNPPPVQDFQNYQQYLQKRAGIGHSTSPPTNTQTTTTSKPQHCDGVDEIGCFQVRLYYDWFLIPGSCKCWRPDYFSRYIRRKFVGPEL